jgi:hypothetical protein
MVSIRAKFFTFSYLLPVLCAKAISKTGTQNWDDMDGWRIVISPPGKRAISFGVPPLGGRKQLSIQTA